MKERLFLSSGFNSYQIGLAQDDHWVCCQENYGHMVDQFCEALQPCLDLCNFEYLTIFMLNGPGSTLGIRTLCAFVKALLALDKITSSRVYVSNNLSFAQEYLFKYNKAFNRPICARVNLTKTLCLRKGSILPLASEEEKKEAIWLEHPCLPLETEKFIPQMDKILGILTPNSLWKSTQNPDIFQDNISA